jgi:MSHA biogenesis protein MshO
MKTRGEIGFTLIEMVIVIALTGIIAGVVAVFLRAPIQQYADLTRRAELTDVADSAQRRIARDLRHALPNSVRLTIPGGCAGTNACALEFIPTVDGGRYRTGSGDELDFATADTSFDVVGPVPAATAAHHLVIYNLGIEGADAYEGSTEDTHVRRPIATVGAGNLTITSTERFPFESPGQRFHVTESPVSYVCDPQAGTLTRTSGYGWPEAPVSGTAHLLAQHVSQCRFTYDQAVSAQRAGLITMHLSLTDGSETVTLYHAVHVSNQP